jgi:hypothetical protein
MTRIESGVTIPKGLFTLYLNVKKVTAKIVLCRTKNFERLVIPLTYKCKTGFMVN